MTLVEFIPFALLILLAYICTYTLVDRICKCVEYCALTRTCIDGLEGLNEPAEMRRASKQKNKTATYNLTEEQLNAIVREKVETEMAKAEERATEKAIDTAMLLMLTLPLEVLIDHYWKKSYAKRIPEFTNYVLGYYEKWINDELDMAKLREDLWLYGGVKLEKTEE